MLCSEALRKHIAGTSGIASLALASKVTSKVSPSSEPQEHSCQLGTPSPPRALGRSKERGTL